MCQWLHSVLYTALAASLTPAGVWGSDSLLGSRAEKASAWITQTSFTNTPLTFLVSPSLALFFPQIPPTPQMPAKGHPTPWSLIRCSSDRWWPDGNPGLSPHKACLFANHILYWLSSWWRWPCAQWWGGNLRVVPSSTGSGDLRILTLPSIKPGWLTSLFRASILFLTCK